MVRRRRAMIAFLAVPLLLGAGLAAQASGPVATSLAAIERYPVFFHGRQVSFIATPEPDGTRWRVLVTEPRHLIVLPKSGQPPQHAVELRGTLLDIGKLSEDDSRLSALGLRPIVQALYGDRWPPRETLFALVGASWVDEAPAEPATVRSVALHPEAFEGRKVTLQGRFRAQNLFGDLPAWPRQSQWDFVLQSADAAIWITGKRPRGRGFDLDPGTRRAAGTWLQATGTVHVVEGLPRLEASAITEAAPVAEAPPPDIEPAPALPPAMVIFSAPLDGETGIELDAIVRVQFSRDMDEKSFDGNVRVTYGTGGAAPVFEVLYRPINRSIDLRFKTPLAAGTDVVVTLTDGILASDGSPFTPATIRFRTKESEPAAWRPWPHAPRR